MPHSHLNRYKFISRELGYDLSCIYNTMYIAIENEIKWLHYIYLFVQTEENNKQMWNKQVLDVW